MVSIAREGAGFQNTCGDRGAEQFAVPIPMLLSDNGSRRCTAKNLCNRFLHALKRLPIPACCQGVPVLPILLIHIRIPRTSVHAINELRSNAVPFDRE